MGSKGIGFSDLTDERKNEIRLAAAPPDLGERYGCYSTPMYYLFNKGRLYDGTMDKDPAKRFVKNMKGKPGPDFGTWRLDRNRPDWQEVVIRDWVELGLNSIHFLIQPNKDLKLSSNYVTAAEHLISICAKYKMGIGVRLDALGGYEAWEMNPDNPENMLEKYLVWVEKIAQMMKGKTAYYVLGDEIVLHENKPGLEPQKWTPEKYLGYFKKVSGIIKNCDPQAKVSMFSALPSRWDNVMQLISMGYSKYGDGIAINNYRYKDVLSCFEEVRAACPEMMFLSNGVGYVNSGSIPTYPQWDPYDGQPYPASADEQEHACKVAKNMFAWWDLGSDAAPYYIVLRNWIIEGKKFPRWYGFFGFEDFVVDKYGNMTIKRYPGWYAFQTIAHTFYNRDEFVEPSFDVHSSVSLDMFRVYEHKLAKGSELVMMLWNDSRETNTSITVDERSYKYPVRISNFNYTDWSDVDYSVTEQGVSFDLKVGTVPIIIRLVKLK